MNRETVRIAVLAICCVIAIALASATLPSPTEVDAPGDGPGQGDEDRIGFGDEREDADRILPIPEGQPETDGDTEPITPICISWLQDFELFVLVLALLLAGAAVLTRLYDLGVGTVFFVFGSTTALVMMVVLTLGCEGAGWTVDFPSASNVSDTVVEGGEGSEGNGDTARPISAPTVVWVLLLLLAALGVAVAAWSVGSSRSDDPTDEHPDGTGTDPDHGAVGAVAGRAADELEADADLENAIYRAWVGMTEALSVDRPESSTPSEFADAAVESGMDPDDVDELTRLFEAVRYGDTAVTDRRERRAIDALRRIEASVPDDDLSVNGELDTGTHRSVDDPRVDDSTDDDRA